MHVMAEWIKRDVVESVELISKYTYDLLPLECCEIVDNPELPPIF
jgi:hypothetical protein